jgi:2-dehydropantoate 2-reductase
MPRTPPASFAPTKTRTHPRSAARGSADHEVARSAPMRVAVLGVGGVGGMVSALLRRRGDMVTVIGRPETAAVVARDGLSVRSTRYGDFVAHVETATELRSPVDVCVVTVKAPQLDDATSRVPRKMLADGIVVPFLNGVEHVNVLRTIYGQAVVPATMKVEAARIAPGVIAHTSPFMKAQVASPPGIPSARRGKIEQLRSHLIAAGIDVEICSDETTMLWDKLVFLAPLALLTTYYRATAGEIRTGHRDELLTVIAEVAAVAQACGAASNADDAVTFFDSVPSELQSSMRRDVAVGRETELDAIAGAVVRQAAAHDIPVSATTKLFDALKPH